MMSGRTFPPPPPHPASVRGSANSSRTVIRFQTEAGRILRGKGGDADEQRTGRTGRSTDTAQCRCNVARGAVVAAPLSPENDAPVAPLPACARVKPTCAIPRRQRAMSLLRMKFLRSEGMNGAKRAPGRAQQHGDRVEVPPIRRARGATPRVQWLWYSAGDPAAGLLLLRGVKYRGGLAVSQVNLIIPY